MNRKTENIVAALAIATDGRPVDVALGLEFASRLYQRHIVQRRWPRFWRGLCLRRWEKDYWQNL
jgi:hypothetical protein